MDYSIGEIGALMIQSLSESPTSGHATLGTKPLLHETFEWPFQIQNSN
jgi:hypothetical protein